MTYTNIPTVTSQQTTNYTSGNIPYTAISLIPDIPHSAQLEVERLFSQDRDGNTATLLAFLADPAVTTAQKKAVFIIPISRCTLNSATSNITAIDLPVSGGTVYNYSVTTPTPTVYTIKIPSLSQHGSSTVIVRRKTVSNQPLVNWVSGSRLTSKQLNLSTTQSLYLIQEALEKIGTSVTIETTQITSTSLSDNAVTSAALAAGAVTTAKIADSAVTTAKIADSAVTTVKLADSTVTTVKLADSTVTTAKIADSAVTTVKIADSTVTTDKIADSAVTTAKIADSAVTTAKIANGSVTSAKLGYTTGNTNTAFGQAALGANTTGSQNTAFGYFTLDSNTTGIQNTAFGREALGANIGGDYNSAFGLNALYFNTGGSSNCAFGQTSLYYNTTGRNNSAFGSNTLSLNVTGENNTAIGRYSLLNCLSSNNTAIGELSGVNLITGSTVICIGHNSQPSSATISNEVNIYNGSITARFAGAATAWTFVSDARDKDNIENLNLGLNFVTQLQPRKFNWNIRNSDVDKGKKASGFIAQELLSVVQSNNADFLGLVYTNDPNQFSIAHTNLIPVLVNAIKELNAKFETYVATHP